MAKNTNYEPFSANYGPMSQSWSWSQGMGFILVGPGTQMVATEIVFL